VFELYYLLHLISLYCWHGCCSQAAEDYAAATDEQQTDVKTSDHIEEAAHEDEQYVVSNSPAACIIPSRLLRVDLIKCVSNVHPSVHKKFL